MTGRTVCVFCGSSTGVDPRYMAEAEQLGETLAAAGHAVIYGGGTRGLMGAVAQGALSKGGTVIGIIPSALHLREVSHPGLTELVVVKDLMTRKDIMITRSDAFVVLPGGLGTLDEAFEVLSQKQLGMLDKPIAVLNSNGFWETQLSMLREIETSGYLTSPLDHLFQVVPSIGAFVSLIK